MTYSTHLLASVFGILGNIISFCVFLSPLPTFYKIHKKKSTEGFQAIPYSVALFSCMLLLYYGYLKTENRMMIITINSIGCAIETSYIVFFLIYATRESLISSVKLLAFFNVISLGIIVATTLFTIKDRARRISVVGWICAVFSVCVFAAPLSIMRLVIKTKSVKYMPFSLSFFLTICAVVWFIYGLLIKDYYVAAPNVLGFVFGIAQMILYAIYKGKTEKVKPVVQSGDEKAETVVDMGEMLKIGEEAEIELGVRMEMQENSVSEIEEVGEISENVAKVCFDLHGEKTIVPPIA